MHCLGFQRSVRVQNLFIVHLADLGFSLLKGDVQLGGYDFQVFPVYDSSFYQVYDFNSVFGLRFN